MNKNPGSWCLAEAILMDNETVDRSLKPTLKDSDEITKGLMDDLPQDANNLGREKEKLNVEKNRREEPIDKRSSYERILMAGIHS